MAKQMERAYTAKEIAKICRKYGEIREAMIAGDRCSTNGAELILEVGRDIVALRKRISPELDRQLKLEELLSQAGDIYRKFPHYSIRETPFGII